MTYTDGARPPKPTQTEREFATLTDEQREAMSKQWVKAVMGAHWVVEIYPPLREEPK